MSGYADPDDPAISLVRLAGPSASISRALRVLLRMADRVLGIHEINRRYRTGIRPGVDPFEFARQTLDTLEIGVEISPAGAVEHIPRSGPVLLVSNHPFGGAEALCLVRLLCRVRADVRFLANGALRVFPELAPLLIPVNPLTTEASNVVSVRRCQTHLESGGLLVVFPAGRVASYYSGRQRITDAPWNRLVDHLLRYADATLLAVHFPGTNSRAFHLMGRIWEPFRMLMLPRELLGKHGELLRVELRWPISSDTWRKLPLEDTTPLARLLSTISHRPNTAPATPTAVCQCAPLARRGPVGAMLADIGALPQSQLLVGDPHFSVFWADARQISALMREIARERERTFRALDEGSGAELDTDGFDASYVHLFAWDWQSNTLVGTYRMGRTDQLRSAAGKAGLYLSQMFEFAPAFHDSAPPALELGRSFVAPEHQRSYRALYLLWQGIGRYLVQHPQYRRLYGTVSLSRQFNDIAVAMLCDALIEPGAAVRPRYPLRTPLPPEWIEFRQLPGSRDLSTLSAIVRSLDASGKDLPVLLRHYHRIGARFHCVAVDPNFRNTPGLLLSVDLDQVEARKIAPFFGDGLQDYLSYAAATRDAT